MTERKDSSRIPFFVVGSGRSGTTLLRGILNASEEVYIPHESDFIARAYRFYSNRTAFSDADYLHLAEFFRLTSQKKGWGFTREEIYGALRSAAPQHYADINDTIYHYYLQRMGFAHSQWGIKAPVLTASLDIIRKVFPKARIVHMLRDGRDVYLSYRRVHEREEKPFGPRNVLQTALYWVDGLRHVEAFAGPDLIELRYEDLLHNPEQEVARLCRFLQITYRPQLWQEYQHSNRNKELLLQKQRLSIHAKVPQGINASNTAKYSSVMSRRERFVFELLAGPYLQKYGYPCEFENLDRSLDKALRAVLYTGAHLYNKTRYSLRDYKYYRTAARSVKHLADNRRETMNDGLS